MITNFDINKSHSLNDYYNHLNDEQRKNSPLAKDVICWRRLSKVHVAITIISLVLGIFLSLFFLYHFPRPFPALRITTLAFGLLTFSSAGLGVIAFHAYLHKISPQEWRRLLATENVSPLALN